MPYEIQNKFKVMKQVQSNETRMLAIATKIGEYEQEAKVVLKKKALKYKRWAVETGNKECDQRYSCNPISLYDRLSKVWKII